MFSRRLKAVKAPVLWSFWSSLTDLILSISTRPLCFFNTHSSLYALGRFLVKACELCIFWTEKNYFYQFSSCWWIFIIIINDEIFTVEVGILNIQCEIHLRWDKNRGRVLHRAAQWPLQSDACKEGKVEKRSFPLCWLSDWGMLKELCRTLWSKNKIKFGLREFCRSPLLGESSCRDGCSSPLLVPAPRAELCVWCGDVGSGRCRWPTCGAVSYIAAENVMDDFLGRVPHMPAYLCVSALKSAAVKDRLPLTTSRNFLI